MSVSSAEPGRVLVRDQEVKTCLVVFDKDGTLVDFNHLWGRRTRQWLETLAQQVNRGETLYQALSRSMGYDPAINHFVSDGPLAVAPMHKLYAIAASVLYRHGLGWIEAEEHVHASLSSGIVDPPTANDIKPRGDVSGLFRRLKQAGIMIAVATNDDRVTTEVTLSLLEVREQVNLLVCGDDDLPSKPAPDAIWHAGSQLGVDPALTVMVGDTVSDMIAGRGAGAGCCIGVLHGVGDPDKLAEHADVVIDSIDEIQVL